MAFGFRRTLLTAAGLGLLASPALAQRPALTGEKARVAEEVRADLTRLSELQRAHHARTKVYAADARDLSYTPTSGAQVNIAYASMNAWAANATHPALSPVACFVIISSAEPTGPASEPFCQEGRPGTPAPAPPPATTPTTTPTTTPPASSTAAPRRPAAPVLEPQAPPRTQPQLVSTPPQRTAAPTRPAPAPAPAEAPPARAELAMSPVTPAAPLRPLTVTDPATSEGLVRTEAQAAVDIPVSARADTRDASAEGVMVPSQVENVTAAEFSQRLAEFAQGALNVFFADEADAVRVLRDPYESTAEFEARRAAAIAAARRREADFFQQNTRGYNVALPVRDVRYDADREVLEFTVDGVALPVARGEGALAGESTLALTCYTRPVLWCSPDDGMLYEAGDLWHVTRALARQHDVLRNPLVLYARFAVGRREDSRTLAVSLLSMDLQARGQSVQRWDGGAR